MTNSELFAKFAEHIKKVWNCEHFPQGCNGKIKKVEPDATIEPKYVGEYFHPWGGYLGEDYDGILIIGGNPSAYTKGLECMDEKAFKKTEEFVEGKPGAPSFEALMQYYRDEWIGRWGNIAISKIWKWAQEGRLRKSLPREVAYINLVNCRCVSEKNRKNFPLYKKIPTICLEWFKDAMEILRPRKIILSWKGLADTFLKKKEEILNCLPLPLKETFLNKEKIELSSDCAVWKGRGPDKENFEIVKKVLENP